MKIPLKDFTARGLIGETVRFKSIEQIEANPKFSKEVDLSGYSADPNGASDIQRGPWMHVPTSTYVYVFPNYTASPNEEFVITGCRLYEYLLEMTTDALTKVNSKRVSGYFFELEKVGNPDVKLFGVLHEALNFTVRYGNVRIEFEVEE